jgi:phosphate starvation-inducible protein PhoH
VSLLSALKNLNCSDFVNRNFSVLVEHKTTYIKIYLITSFSFNPLMKKDRQRSIDEQVTRFSPKNDAQKKLIESIWNNWITIACGPPGTGKTLFAIQTLLDLLKQKEIRKIVIIRLISDTCEEHLSALPGVA